MSPPEVSVVVPFLNARAFLEESIASVRAQTYSSWELLLVDDGSDDGGTDIARAHAARDPDRVRYLEHPGHQRRGISASLNLGIRHAAGRFIAPLDADDVWLPAKLQAQVEILAMQPEAAMVYQRTQYWYSWTGKPEDRRRDYLEKLGVAPNTLVSPPALLSLILRGQSPVPCPCNILIRRDAVQRVGGFEERFFNLFTDQAFYAKVFLSMPVFAADGCWARYRRHPSQSTAAAESSGRIWKARKLFLKWLEQYLNEHGARGSDVWHALQHALRPSRIAPDGRPFSRREIWTRWLRRAGTRTLPWAVQDGLRRLWRGPAYVPPVGRVRFGDLRRAKPVAGIWGLERGLPIDRYYIEWFLARHARDIRGSVLEVGDARYTWRFGFGAVTSSDVLNVAAGHPETTIVADLSCPEQVPLDQFDCVIAAQTLQLIADLESAVRALHRMLRPGGVALVTLPGISQTHHADWGGHWRWNFTSLSARALFEAAFASADVEVETHGNVLAATAFLQGLTAEDLRPDELDYEDPDYQVSILVRAVRGRTSR